jgi:hypothetical protein
MAESKCLNVNASQGNSMTELIVLIARVLVILVPARDASAAGVIGCFKIKLAIVFQVFLKRKMCAHPAIPNARNAPPRKHVLNVRIVVV